MGHPTFFFSAGERHNPDVRRLCICFEIHIDHAEDHPLAIGRDFGFAQALELHHVFEGEGMLGLGQGRKCKRKSKEGEKKMAHEGNP